MTKFAIYEGLMEDLRKKVKRVEKKCNRYGCPFSYEEVGETFKEFKNPDDPDHPFVYRFIEVEVEGTAKKEDWEFVASIEHTPEGNIYHKSLTDIEIPVRYRDCRPYCEHCNTDRPRKKTYIVHNTATGEFKQLASSCVKDYTRGLSAEMFAFYASIVDLFAEEENAYGTGHAHWTILYKVEDFLLYVSECINYLGYVKKYDDYGERNPYATATSARLLYEYDFYRNQLTKYEKNKVYELQDKIEKKGTFNPVSDENKARVKEALDWLFAQEEPSDYLHNVQVVAKQKYIDGKNLGILCSLLPVAYKAINNIKEQAKRVKEEANSEYVGTVGERKDFVLTFVREAHFDTEFGVTYVYTFKDENGNIFVWKTGNILNLKENDKVTVKGTIKEHNEYKHVKQTVITRCKVA